MGSLKQKPHLPPIKIGMRAIKTVVALFICCVLDYMRGEVPLQSGIAAIICIQPDAQNSVKMAATRAAGTVLGGFFGALVLIVFEAAGVRISTVWFYFIVCLLMLALIYVPVRLGVPEATALTCIVFISVTFNHTGEFSPVYLALTRSLDTLIGIFVALPVNSILPNPRLPAKQDEEQPGG